MKQANIRFTYDQGADAVYMYFTNIKDGEICDTLTIDDDLYGLTDTMNVDISKQSKILGIEILHAQQYLPESFLKKLEDGLHD